MGPDFPRILVLGATGRLGGLLRRAWPAGRGLWQARSGRAGPPETGTGGEWVRLDPLAEPAALAGAAARAAAILCLAGVTPAAAARGAALADNTALALAAVRAGAAVGVPVLLVSSAAVYGAQGGLLGEAAPLVPVSDYGRAKAETEDRAARLGAELGVPVTSLRIGNVAGADAILGGWTPGFWLDRFADGRTPRRSYIGPATLACVLADLAAAAGQGRLPGVLNVAAPGLVEMGALLDAAGLTWTARPAPAEAIPEVALDVAELSALVPLGPETGTARTLVAEWRALAQEGEA